MVYSRNVSDSAQAAFDEVIGEMVEWFAISIVHIANRKFSAERGKFGIDTE